MAADGLQSPADYLKEAAVWYYLRLWLSFIEVAAGRLMELTELRGADGRAATQENVYGLANEDTALGRRLQATLEAIEETIRTYEYVDAVCELYCFMRRLANRGFLLRRV
jgi:hypothetical protein